MIIYLYRCFTLQIGLFVHFSLYSHIYPFEAGEIIHNLNLQSNLKLNQPAQTSITSSHSLKTISSNSNFNHKFPFTYPDLPVQQIHLSHMSGHRVYFKNDNFFLATLRENQLKEKQEAQKQKILNNTKAKKNKVTTAKNKQEKVTFQIKKKDEQIISKHLAQSTQDLFKVSNPFGKYDSHQNKDSLQVDMLLSTLKKKQKNKSNLQICLSSSLMKIQQSRDQTLIKEGSFKQKSLDKTSDKFQQNKDQNLNLNFIQGQNVKQATTNSNHKSFNIFKNIYKPTSTLKVEENKTEQKIELNENGKPKKKREKTQAQLQKQRQKQDRIFKHQLKTLLEDLESQPEKDAVKKNPYEPTEQKKNYEEKKLAAQNAKNSNTQNGVKLDQQKQKQGANKKSKNKTKKINNYQRLDLKRKYKDKFVGGLRDNQRKYQKNGALKFKYRMAQSQIEFTDGELYNSYIHSLSKSFHVDINLDSESQEEQEAIRQIQIPNPEQSNKERLTCLIQEMFGFQKFREGQYQVIMNIMNNKSTIFVSQTASGKSLTYIISSLIMSGQNDGMSIVISPLIALMLDQLQHLPIEVPAACISSLINYEQRDKILHLVKENQVKLLFMTPETLMTDILFHLKQFPKINFVCIDEAHCLSQLSHNFRTSYIALSQIILNQIAYNNQQAKPNILCLTATANTETIQSLSKKLSIEYIIKSSSTLNKNLYITITREIGSELKFRSLVDYLSNKQIQKSRGILIYCRSKYLIEKVFHYLSNSNMPATVFHGALTNKQKTKIISDFKTQTIKIIISTTALGMGLDFQHLDCIIHFNMAKSLQSFVQQIGRAGRRQNRAYCHLFLDESDFFMQRNYILADQLQPKSLRMIIEEIQKSKRISKPGRFKPKTAKNNKKKQEQKSEEELERVIKRASMMIYKIEEQKNQDQQENQVQDQINKDNEALAQIFEDLSDDQNPFQDGQFSNQTVKSRQQINFLPLYFLRVKQLAEKTYLRQEALLTILMKIAQLINQQLDTDSSQIMKILPLSNQILKLSFFRSNQNKLIESELHGDFYRKLIDLSEGKNNKPKCKKVNGSYHINLISKCNELHLNPIQLMSKVYEISNEFVMKVQFVNQIYVFSLNERLLKPHQPNLRISFKEISQKLRNLVFQNRIIETVNEIENTSMTKLNVFYSLAFNYSQISVFELIKRKLIIGRQVQIPKDNIMNEISKYFNTDLNSFYNYIAETEDQLEREMFLPTQIVDQSQTNNVYEHIKLFFKHLFSNLRDMNNHIQALNKKQAIVDEFKDGKIITRVFLGVNEEKSSRLIYSEHTYWRKFLKKKYSHLLHTVRKLIDEGRQDLISS